MPITGFKNMDFNEYALSYLLLAPSTLHNALLLDSSGNPVTVPPTSKQIQDAMTAVGFVGADIIVQTLSGQQYFTNLFSGPGMNKLIDVAVFLGGVYSAPPPHPKLLDVKPLIDALQALAQPY
jgi:hypothetical protein